MTTAIALSVAAAPFLGLAGLFWLLGAVRERRWRAIARQIALTDEIHRELGAAAAPFVTARAGGRWQVRVAVPLDSPGTVGALVRIIHASFTSRDSAGAAGLEIVLTPRAAGRWPALTDAGRQVGRAVTVRAAHTVGAVR